METKFGYKVKDNDMFLQEKGIKTTDEELELFDTNENVMVEDSFVIYGAVEISDVEND